MARRRRHSTSSISIGNCTVDIDGDNISCETPNRESLLISVSDAAKIRISVTDSRKYMTRRSHRNLLSTLSSQDDGKESNPLEAHSFLLLNPKDIDSSSKLLLQKVLNVYTKELPSMNYAANTGKKSLFLERCVMSGKYKTLVLALNSFKGFEEVIAAVTYQIIPSDTQYAEIPLTAVSSIYQNVGFGHLLYGELMKRLRNVGILTIFCWADKESEGFWLKQGFLSIADVDTKGRVHKLPIRADIRRALCFPGGSTLMVAHLKKDIPATASPAEHMRSCVSLKSHAKTHIHSMTPGVDDSGQAHVASKIVSEKDIPAAASPAEHVRSCASPKSHAKTHIHVRTSGVDDSGQAHVGSKSDSENGKKLDGSSPSHIRSQGFTDSVSLKGAGCNDMTIDLGFANDGHDVDLKQCCCSGRSIKKRVWEGSLSSLKSKRVKAGHHNNCHLDSECNFSCDHDRGNSDTIDDCSLDASRCKSLTTKDSLRLSLVVHSEENRAVCGTTEDNVSTGLASKGGHSTIMFMNIADQTKKTWLRKIVEELGGSVTSEGNACTHVITGKARKTLNFCVALCSGAWIVSSNWLKSSFKAGKFLDESQFILEDKDYVLKYKFDLRDAVSKAKANPHALLNGYQVFLAKHIQPSVEILSAIIVAAGGDVVRRLDNMKEPSKTIFLACEEDMEEAMVAAKKGVWTYCSDWFMSCVMRQELDFEAPQFAESL